MSAQNNSKLRSLFPQSVRRGAMSLANYPLELVPVGLPEEPRARLPLELSRLSKEILARRFARKGVVEVTVKTEDGKVEVFKV